MLLVTHSMGIKRLSGLLMLLIAFWMAFAMLADDAWAQGKIAVSVNNGIVTSNQVNQRARFLRLTGFKGDAQAEAQKQLIDEELQFQEGKRVGFNIPGKAVDDAFARVASSNKATPKQFAGALRSRGVNPETFKTFIEAKLLWQQIVLARARAEGNQSKAGRDITSILFNRDGDGKNVKVKEYTLEQIIFVLKKDASKKAAQQRLREVEAFRRSNKSCEQASESVKKLAANGVIMKPVGRYTSDSLPQGMRREVLDAEGQLFTAPQRGQSGIGIMAICKTREIVDNGATGGFGDNIGTLDSKELEAKSKEWMAEIYDRARIVIR